MSLPLHAQHPKLIEYYNLGGTVFNQQLPIDQFRATLIYNYSDIYVYIKKENFDTLGYFYFLNLPNGNYLVKAEPMFPGDYVPTYYGNYLHWKEAIPIPLFNDLFNEDIQMIPAPGYIQGPAHINGSVEAVRASGDKQCVPNIEILLLNPAEEPLTYRLTDASGFFSFANIAYGAYYVYVEIEGKTMNPVYIVLDENNPQVELEFNVLEAEILAGIDDQNEWKAETVSLFPNPVSNNLSLSYNPENSHEGNWFIYSIDGCLQLSSDFRFTESGSLQIDCSLLSEGIYYIALQGNDGLKIVKKFVVGR